MVYKIFKQRITEAGFKVMTLLSKKTIMLVLGGARSGKTAYAEERVLAFATNGKTPIYIATAQAFDDEMSARIERHQDLRSDRFETAEEPLDLIKMLNHYDDSHVLLVDSIGVWITNHMMTEHDFDAIIDATVSALINTKASVVLVSDEVGMGIVPEGAMSRSFRDHIGMMNQRVGQIADTVAFLVAGLPMMIKSE